MIVKQEREKGAPVLVLDAGNALFKSPDVPAAPDAKPRAELLLAQMEAQGTAAMAVGARDLVLGVDFLKKRTKAGKMKLLSANLVDAAGKRVFPASLVTDAGGLKVGVVGVSLPSPESEAKSPPPAVRGLPTQPAVEAEVERLRAQKVDVMVLLAAVPYPEALRLAEAVEGVDFLVQSHDGRGAGMARRQGLTTLVPPGERGRQVAKLELSIDGPGRFADRSEAQRAQESLRILETNITRAKERLATAKPEDRQALEQTIASFEARRTALQATARDSATVSPRTHLLSYIQLGSDVPSDPAVQKLVERIEPPGSAAH